ncbi:hypothetical protein [Streptomyces europaeiscabiei]|uniref:hypothetical protein n=1 Tax=Streptomyces europaeiscabiei TaxID=146819 RepID=UPI00299FE74F|nr:hypothetical protein [Streptomyces europaeiscabiei]MDX3775910.1 hypothetical protein [Streptomyces europaeiscabiei]
MNTAKNEKDPSHDATSRIGRMLERATRGDRREWWRAAALGLVRGASSALASAAVSAGVWWLERH